MKFRITFVLNSPTLSVPTMAHLQTFPKTQHLLLYFPCVTLFVSLIQSQGPPSYYYNLCSSSTCNNLTLPYPFTFPTPCHPPALQPSCPTNQSLLLTSPRSTDIFRVLSINFTSDTSTTSLYVTSDSLFTCNAQVSRPNYQSDASVFSLPFNYTPGTHLNCTAPIISSSIQGLQNAPCLGCEGQDLSNVCYYAPGFVTAPNCETYHMFTPGRGFNASGVGNLRAFLQRGYQLRYVKPMECRGCEASGGRCGASLADGSFVCFCSSSAHRGNCSDGMTVDLSSWVNGGGGGSGPSKAVVAAISASASLLLLVVIVALVVIYVRRKSQNIHFNKDTISSISPKRYSYSQLKKFTNNFSSKLGEGGFGSVYKGTIHRDGAAVLVAVKVLKNSRQIEKQFMREVATIGSVHHHNLVGMLGYCVDGKTHALVYEFMENGSLDKYIYSSTNRHGVADNIEAGAMKLTSKQVYSIALETARGILYLHEGCRLRILHFDIKPANVLLDCNFSAKVADFGLARMIDKDHSHVSLTAALGTPGYTAPEMWLKTFGPVTEKADVYSYGMLLLEMVGRRKNYDPEVADSSQAYFPEWLYNKISEDEFSLLRARGSTDASFKIVANEENRNEDDEVAIQRMCLVGLWCIQYIPSNRPSMDGVIQMLEGHAEIGIPPCPFPENSSGIPLMTFPESSGKHESTG